MAWVRWDWDGWLVQLVGSLKTYIRGGLGLNKVLGFFNCQQFTAKCYDTTTTTRSKLFNDSQTTNLQRAGSTQILNTGQNYKKNSINYESSPSIETKWRQRTNFGQNFQKCYCIPLYFGGQF